ncbi:hypothetical protein KSP39_PZI004520 [Platanthera zijinensis]|uniref:Uncharacterized protein n=1 Tax=Platanthera zijinensis TaxID=2320716 RepID=A0AAP0BTY3_9ASPA
MQAHPAVKHYRDKVIVNWADLGTICGCDKATGSDAATGYEATNAIDLDDSGGEESYSCGKRIKSSTSSQPSKKKNPTSDDILTDAVSSIARSLTLPASCVFVIKSASYPGFLLEDPLFSYVLLTQFTLPPAVAIDLQLDVVWCLKIRMEVDVEKGETVAQDEEDKAGDSAEKQRGARRQGIFFKHDEVNSKTIPTNFDRLAIEVRSDGALMPCWLLQIKDIINFLNLHPFHTLNVQESGGTIYYFVMVLHVSVFLIFDQISEYLV